MDDFNEIRERLKKDPDDPRGLRAVGRHYLQNGEYRQAKNYYAQAMAAAPGVWPEVLIDYEKEIEREPYNVTPRLSLAGLQIVQGDLDSAVLELEEAIEAQPQNIEPYNILGRIYVKQGRMDDTIQLLERSLKEGIKDVSLSVLLAGAYLETDRLAEAVKLYEEVLTFQPGDKNILRILGDLYTRLENFNEAAKRYQAMFSDDPEVGREVVQRLEDLLRKLEGNVFIREVLVDIYSRLLNPEAAVNKLQEILRLDQTKLGEVIDRLRVILKSYPQHPQATLVLAEALRRQGNFSEAAGLYYEVARTDPSRLDKCLAGYLEILDYCPEQVLARGYLAEAKLYQGQVPEALAEYQKMLAFDPTSADLVVKKCREIFKSQPELLAAKVVLGQALLAKGEAQKAITEAEEVIALDKRSTEAYLLLGEAYFQLKHCRKAVECLRNALALEPYNHKVLEKFRQARERELEMEIGLAKDNLVKDEWKLSLHLDLAKLYFKKGLRDEVIRELQLVQKDQARAPFACNLLGCVYRRDGRFDLAAAQFNRALELAPPELADFSRSVRFNLGTAYEAQGELKKALKIYEQILQEELDFGNLKQRVKYLKATSLNSMSARALLMTIARHEPREIIACWGREAKPVQKKQRDEVNESFGQKYNSSGFEYFMKGMCKAAFDEFTLAVQLDSRFAIALNNLAVCLVKESRLAEARGRLEEAVHLEPNSLVLRTNLGILYLLNGELNKAKVELERAYHNDPDSTAATITLGDIHYVRGQIESALKLYKSVGTFNPLAEIVEDRLKFKTPN